MKFLSINGNKVRLPEAWPDVTWSQYKQVSVLELSEEDDDNMLRIVSIFTGLDEDFWIKYKDVGTYLEIAGDLMALVISESDAPFGFVFTHGDKTYKLPEKLELTSLAQYQDCKKIAESALPKEGEEVNIEHINTAYERITKIYIQPIIQGCDYDIHKALELDIDEMRYADVSGWGAFFLNKVLESRNRIQKKLLNSLLTRKRGKQATNGSRKSSE